MVSAGWQTGSNFKPRPPSLSAGDPVLFGIAGFGLQIACNTLRIVEYGLNLRDCPHHIVTGGASPPLKFKMCEEEVRFA